MAGKTQRERQEEKREAALKDMDDQVESGSLSIRQMTPEERAKWGPPKERPAPRRPGRR